MSLKKVEVTKFGGEEVTARELTVIQVAEVMDKMRDYNPHVLDLLMDQDLPIDVVMISTGLSEEQLMAAAPSELSPLYDVVVKVNPHLAALTERLKKAVPEKDAGNLLTGSLSGKSPASL